MCALELCAYYTCNNFSDLLIERMHPKQPLNFHYIRHEHMRLCLFMGVCVC